MIQGKMYWCSICDGCGARHPPYDGDPAAYGHKGDAGVAAFHDGWVEAGELMFCPDCVADGGRKPHVDTLINDVTAELRRRLEHSDVCAGRFDPSECICCVERAVEIVEEFTNDERNGVTVTLGER